MSGASLGSLLEGEPGDIVVFLHDVATTRDELQARAANLASNCATPGSPGS